MAAFKLWPHGALAAVGAGLLAVALWPKSKATPVDTGPTRAFHSPPPGARRANNAPVRPTANARPGSPSPHDQHVTPIVPRALIPQAGGVRDLGDLDIAMGAPEFIAEMSAEMPSIEACMASVAADKTGTLISLVPSTISVVKGGAYHDIVMEGKFVIDNPSAYTYYACMDSDELGDVWYFFAARDNSLPGATSTRGVKLRVENAYGSVGPEEGTIISAVSTDGSAVEAPGYKDQRG